MTNKRKPLRERAIRDGVLNNTSLPTNLQKGPDGIWYIVPDFVEA